MNVLVDTSVWIDHLRRHDRTLAALLEDQAVVQHPFVIGELACGNLRDRSTVLGHLRRLPPVTVASDKGGDVKGLSQYIEQMVGGGSMVKVGKVYEGTVTELKDFGAIVELLPGTDGLCHISQLDESYVKNVEDFCQVGDKMPVKVLAIEGNRIKLSRKAALQEQGSEE